MLANRLDSSIRILNLARSVTSRALSTKATSQNENYDFAIVGGGIVGLATARKLILEHPNLKFILLEKENQLSMHQTGHNSGVIHAGIYYKPGTLKAKLCVAGLEATYKYCDENGIPYKKCGKLIVATDAEQEKLLDGLYERGLQNGVRDLRVVGPEGIREIEPNCVGLRAIHSPHTGIVDWGLVARTYGKNFEAKGGKVVLNFEVDKFETSENPNYPVRLVSKNQKIVNAKYTIVCGGLQSDRLAGKSGCSKYPKIVPFRGDYLVLKSDKSNMVNGNIYPVPNPKFPFLGVHFTPRMDGSVWLGPNAVLAFKREGYKLLDFNFRDTLEEASFGNFKYALGELYRGFSIPATVKELRKFVPSLQVADVVRGPSGVRAQALDTEGNLVDDFIFDSGSGELSQRMLHVRNAPSPAATSSLAIANVISDEVKNRFKL